MEATLSQGILYQAFQERRDAAGPVFDSLRQFLKQKCEEHLQPGAEEYVDWRERKAAFWTERMGGRFLPRVCEHLSVAGVVLDKSYGLAARDILNTIVEHRIAEKANSNPKHVKPYAGWCNNP